jgi:c-di-GMP-binding flagellar brake protein YcgR
VETHPDINDPVVLRDHADREYRSRVEDLGEGLLVVARPHGLPADEPFDSGTELSVAWADARGGVTVLPTRILTAYAEGTLQLWSLIVTGPASVDQRRRFVRVTATGPVVLRPGADDDTDETDAVTGSLLDVSEGGVRCAVRAGAADAFLAGDSAVVAEFRLGAADFAVPGRVEFLRPTTHPTEVEELVVVFDEPVADADALRKQVFAQELRTLRTRGEGEDR